ncbi:MAG: Acetyltransferase, GNAT family, partial [uncultured Quadrisphaera sp.]
GRAAHRPAAPAAVARGGPRTLRGAQRRPRGDGALPGAPGAGRQRRPRRPGGRPPGRARVGPVGGGGRGPGPRRRTGDVREPPHGVRGLHRPGPCDVRGVVHARRRGRLAPGPVGLGPRLRHRGRHRGPAPGLRRPGAGRGRLLHRRRQRALAGGDGAARPAPRPRRRLRPPAGAGGLAAAPPRALPHLGAPTARSRRAGL